jgi:hypothetical protein
MEQHYSPHKVNAYVREQMTTLLHANDIYDFDTYGWIDADTHDPEMVGHAMHQVDSLSWRFLETAMASPSPPQLEGWQKFLVRSGGDFEGLMKATRLSIGLMLFQDTLVRENTDESDSFFPLHLMSSMILLGSASDRLRDFFIAATAHKTTEEYEKGQKRRSYTKPFHQARERLQGPLSTPARSLCTLAVKIEKFRRMRNEIVHVISTELGRREQGSSMSRLRAPMKINLIGRSPMKCYRSFQRRPRPHIANVFLIPWTGIDCSSGPAMMPSS